MALNMRIARARKLISFLEYLDTLLFGASIVIAAVFWHFHIWLAVWQALGTWVYAGAFMVGIFYASSFTAAIAAVGLYQLGHIGNPYAFAILAGCGAMLGDYVIFRFIKENILGEFKKLLRHFPHAHSVVRTFFTARAARFVLLALGGILIASPLPDDFGVVLLSVSRIRRSRFLALSFILNAAGILGLVLLGSIAR